MRLVYSDTYFLFQAESKYTLESYGVYESVTVEQDWDSGETYEFSGHFLEIISHALSVCTDLIPSLLADAQKVHEERKCLKSLNDVVKGSTYFQVHIERKNTLEGLRGLNQCTVVADTDYVCAYGGEGHVTFRNLIGTYLDAEEKDVSSGRVLLYALSNNEVSSFLSLALTQIKPYEGLNANAMFALRTLCRKSYWTEKDVFMVSGEDEAAASTISLFVKSLIPRFESGASMNPERIKVGGCVLLKNEEGLYKLCSVSKLEENNVEIKGTVTKV